MCMYLILTFILCDSWKYGCDVFPELKKMFNTNATENIAENHNIIWMECCHKMFV